MKFICYPKCTTCQKAKKWLEQNNIDFDEVNIRENNPTYMKLSEWYGRSGLPLRKFFNTSGILYKSMSLKDKLDFMSDEEMLNLLASDGMLVKRPIVVTEEAVLVGFNEKLWSEALLK